MKAGLFTGVPFEHCLLLLSHLNYWKHNPLGKSSERFANSLKLGIIEIDMQDKLDEQCIQVLFRIELLNDCILNCLGFCLEQMLLDIGKLLFSSGIAINSLLPDCAAFYISRANSFKILILSVAIAQRHWVRPKQLLDQC